MSGRAHPAVFDGPLGEALAAQRPADELDGGPTLGWFGLYSNRGMSGGAVLHRDTDGCVTSWYTPSTVRLERAWAEIRAAIDAVRTIASA